MKFSFLVRKQDNKSREQFMTAASMIRSLIDATLNMQFPYFKNFTLLYPTKEYYM